MHKLFRWSGAVLAVWFSLSMRAAVFTVTGTVDNTDTTIHGGAGTAGDPFQMASLRGAVSKANATAGADIIFLPAGTYTLAITGNEEQANATGDLDILDHLTIVGSGGNTAGDPNVTIIKGAAAWDDKIIDINPNNNLLLNVTIQAVTIRDGHNTGVGDYYGGGINMFGRPNLSGTGAAGSLTIDNCVITANSVVNGGNEGGGGLLAEQVHVSINNTVFSNNSSGDDVGGGISNPGINENFTMTGSTLSGNTAGGGFDGGGLAVRRLGLGALSAGGTISISGSTFSLNRAGGRGGAISLSIQSGGNAVTTGISVQNCTVSGNVAGDTLLGSGPAEGGGIYYSGDTVPNAAPVTFDKNAIINNSLAASSADKRGGGGIAVGSGNATLTWNRFFANTLNSAASGANQGSGLHKDNNPGTLTANENWWASNAGPGGAGNTAVVSGGGSSAGVITASKWLVLRVSPASATGSPGTGDLLTADFLTDSASGAVSAANLVAFNGAAVTFNNAVLGVISGASGSISSGAATATFTPNGAGAATADVTVDNVTVTASISIPTTVASINRDSATPSSLASVSWTIQFVGAVSGLTPANFSLVNTGLGGAPAITSVTPVGVAPATQWTVTAGTGSGGGTLGLNMINDTGVSVPVSNLTFTGEVYTLDLTAPDTLITATPSALSSSATAGFIFTGSDGTGTGVASFEAALDAGTFLVATSPVNLGGLADGAHTFKVRAIDNVGNVDATPAVYTWTVDTTPPAASISAPSVSITTGGAVTYTITYTDANFNTSTLAVADVKLIKTGNANGTVLVDAATGANRTVTISGITGDGTLGISIVANTASDLAGNQAPATGPAATFTVDNTVPAIAVSAPSPGLTAGGAVTYTITYSDVNFNASTLATGDITLVKTGNANGTVAVDATSGATRTVTISGITGDGTLGILIGAGTANDLAGNQALAAGPISTFTVDNTAPPAPVIGGITTDTGSSASDRITSDTTLVLGGTAEAGSTVTVSRTGAGVLGTVTANGAGAWSFDYSGTVLPEGAHTFTATATDAAANLSAVSGDFIVTVDTTAPLAPVITGIVTDTGSSAGDGITSDTALVLSGTAEAGSMVSVSRTGTGLIGTAAANGAGVWSFDYSGTVLTDGAYPFTASAADTAGNISLASVDFVVTVDTTAPAAPVITGITTDTGSSSGDRITSDRTLVLSGAAEAGSVVTVSRTGTGVIGIVTANGSSAWIFDYTGTVLPEGVHTFTATATDTAGNISLVSVNFAVTVDTTAPPAPVITGIATDTGSSASDGITSDTTLALNGTAEAGSTVTVSRTGTGVIGTVTANGAGAWSFDYSGTALPDGAHTFTATATDTAGNISASSANFTGTLDATAPPAPVIGGITTDTGSSAGDRITSDTTLVLSGTAEAGTTVTVSRTGMGVIGTATASGSGAWSFDYSGTVLPDGAHTFSATASDTAGNISLASANFNVTVDTTAPSPPAITGITTDTGVSGTDRVTFDRTLVLSGTAEANSTVTVSLTGTGVIGATTANGAGAWSFDYTGTSLPEGGATFTATTTDVAGNLSPGSAGLAVTVDLTAPDATGISGPAAGSYGLVNLDLVVTYGEPVFVDTTGGTPSLSLVVGVAGRAAAYVSGSGTTSLLFRYFTQPGDTGSGFSSGALASLNGGTITDLAGNAANLAVPVFNGPGFIFDTEPPGITFSVPSTNLTSRGPVAYTVTYHDKAFYSSTLLASQVILTATGTAHGTALVLPPLDPLLDHRVVVITNITGDGSLAISLAPATATDVANNSTLAAGPSQSFQVDNTAPAAPVFTGITPDTGVSGTDRITRSPALVIAGTAAPDSVVALSRADIGLVGAAAVAADGRWSFDHGSTPLGDGHYTFIARAMDAAGNASEGAAELAVTVDTVAPTVVIGQPSVTVVTGGGLVSYAVIYTDVNFGTTGLTSEDVTVIKTGTANAKVVVSGAGASRLVTLADLSGDGTLGIAIAAGTAIDLAGNMAPAVSATVKVTVESKVPAAPVITGLNPLPGGALFIANPQPALFGKSEAGTTVQLFEGDLGHPVTGPGAVMVDAGGNWNFQFTVPLNDGSHVFLARAASGAATLSALSLPFQLTVDTIAPAVTLGAPSVALVGKPGLDVTYGVSYTDANPGGITLGAGDVILAKTGTATGTVTVDGLGGTRTVTLGNLSGAGTIGILLRPGTGEDLAGNLAPGAGPSISFVVNLVRLTVTPTPDKRGVVVTGIGLPGTAYDLQATAGLSPANWAPLTVLTAGPDGTLLFEDRDVGAAGRLYRTLAR